MRTKVAVISDQSWLDTAYPDVKSVQSLSTDSPTVANHVQKAAQCSCPYSFCHLLRLSQHTGSLLLKILCKHEKLDNSLIYKYKKNCGKLPHKPNQTYRMKKNELRPQLHNNVDLTIVAINQNVSGCQPPLQMAVTSCPQFPHYRSSIY